MEKSIEKMGISEYMLWAQKLGDLKDPMVAVDFLSVVPQKIISDFASNVLFPHLKKNPNQIPNLRKKLPKTMDYLLTSSTQVRTGPLPPGKKRKKGSLIQTSDFLPLDIVAELFEFTVEKPREFVNLILGIVGGGRYETFKKYHTNALRNIWWTPFMIEKYEEIHKKPPYLNVYKLSLVKFVYDYEFQDITKDLSGDYPSLMSLNLSRNCDIPPKTFNIIEKFEKLKELILNSMCLEKIPQLNILTRIYILKLINNKGIDISGISKLRYNLKELNMNWCFLNKIGEIVNLINLKVLYFSGNEITEIEGLNKLTKLETLGLSSNKFTKIEGLDKLTKLEKLDLNNNQITKIEGLDKLINLKNLNLWGNQITKIEGLDKLINLKKLYLRNNKITKVDRLNKLESLEELQLQHNVIITIEGLKNLINLELLFLEDNRIREIEDLDELPNLKFIDIRENPLKKYIRFGKWVKTLRSKGVRMRIEPFHLTGWTFPVEED